MDKKTLLLKINRQEERIKWLHETWLELKKFRMSGTGIKKLDFEILSLFGPWR